MKPLKYLSAFLLLTTSFVSLAGKPVPGIAESNQSFAPMLQKTLPAIVNISARGLGSGIIIDKDKGYIITNYHVVRDVVREAQFVTVTLSDGRSMRAKIIGFDSLSDIAVLQITAKNLKSAVFGDSSKLKVGDFVCAIGSPFGLQQTVTSGVISALERSDLGIEGFESFIQTDASINPGSSGGALINMKGEIIGVNTALIASTPSSAGVGLAIPSDISKNVAEQLIKYGKVKRGIMGVVVQNITPALAEALKLPKSENNGALVSQVIEGSPAAISGLHAKDVIVNIMGKPVHSATQVRNMASLSSIGSAINMQVRRNNKLITLNPIITDPEDLKKIQEVPKNLLSGLLLKDVNLLVDNQQIKGIRVLGVDESSVAYSCRLMSGDIIINAADKPVTTFIELQDIANKNPKQLLLEIKRGLAGNYFLVLEE